MALKFESIESLDDGFAQSPLGVHYQPDRVYLEEREPDNMQCYHWHGHVEINLPFEHDVDYLINGRTFTLPANHLGAFWAAVPHRLIERHQCQSMMIAYVPIQTFLYWPLDEPIYNDLLHGAVLASASPYPLARKHLRLLISDFQEHDETLSALVSDELLIMLRRVTRYGWRRLLEPDVTEKRSIARGDPSLVQVQAMLEFMAKNYDKPVTTAIIAQEVGLHPNYAMNQFKKVMRTSIKQYINRMRINHAKALLADTRRSILDIALSVGFSSNSRFYAAFKQYEDMTPQEFRAASFGGVSLNIPEGRHG